MNKTEQHKKAVIEALEKTLGVVTEACKQAGVGRTQFYAWLKDDPEFKAKVDEIEGVALDFAESKLFEKINGVYTSAGSDDEGNQVVYKQPPDTTAIIFYLKTKGKKRGYIERQEIETSAKVITVKESGD